MKHKLLEQFKVVFGENTNAKVYFAPGRVNLIGEHTDYNGGHVFPCALTIGTYAVAQKNNLGKMRFYSMNFEEKGIFEQNAAPSTYEYDKKDDWTNYPKGVMWAFEKKGYPISSGLDILFYGNIPNSSGLSSSASIEVLTGFILMDQFHIDIDQIKNALIGQYAENHFCKVNCGIMDQFAIAMGKKDAALFLDTATLHYEYVPIKLEKIRVVIACSNKKRGLGDSKYNERRRECEEALEILKTQKEIQSLGDLSSDEFEALKHHIEDGILHNRAKHAVYENERTVLALEALQKGEVARFGKLMNESHESLRDLYEVTGVELDTLVESAWNEKGVIGSRMTGAGFGGCTVSLVEEEFVDAFIENVGEKYKTAIGYAADFYVVDIGDGPQIL